MSSEKPRFRATKKSNHKPVKRDVVVTLDDSTIEFFRGRAIATGKSYGEIIGKFLDDCIKNGQ